MGGTLRKTLAAGVAAGAITLGAVGATSPAAAATIWPHGGGWHGGGGGWHGGYGGWHGGYGGWRGGYGGWGWRAGWGPRWGWGYPYGWGWGWGWPAVAVGVSAPACYYPYYCPYYYPYYPAPSPAGCWQVRAVYSQGGVYLGNRTVNVCQ